MKRLAPNLEPVSLKNLLEGRGQIRFPAALLNTLTLRVCRFKLWFLVIDSGLDLGLPLVVVLHTHFGHCVPDRVVLVLLDADELLAGQVELVELSLSELLLRVVSAVVLIVEHALDRQILQVVATKSRRSVSENNWRKIFKVPLFSRNRNRNSVLR